MFLPSGGTASQPFVITNTTALSGVVVLSQSAALVPGHNAANAIASNGVELVVDVF